MSILILTDTDLDGACSALLVKRLYKNSKDIEIVDSSEFLIKKEFLARNSELGEYEKIFILDLDLTEELIPFVDRPNVIVIDHHLNHVKLKDKYSYATTILEENCSCADLIYKKFISKLDPTTTIDDLVKYVNDYDCYTIKFKQSLELNAIYRTYNNPKSEKFIESFNDGFREYTLFEKNSISLYFKKFKEQIETAPIYTGNIKEFKVVSTFANHAINEVAHYIIKKYNADIGIVVNMDTKSVSFRKNRTCSLDLGLIARKLCDGNGSASSAGGVITDKFAKLTKRFKNVN